MAPSADTLGNLRVALVHHWLVRMRGGEKVLEALCQIFPQADIYTLVFDPSEIPASIRQHRITTSWIQKLPWAKKYYTQYLPFFPFAIEQFELSGYDLVISSEAGVSKGVLTRPETCHICYCHTPMRYAWSAYHVYLQAVHSPFRRRLIPFVMNYLRLWDWVSSSRVDYYIANSQNVANRIRKYYRREAPVIYPPVATTDFGQAGAIEDYYLAVGQLVPYKRFDLAVDAFNQLGRPLLIVGDGPEYSRLQRKAGKNIKLLRRTSDEKLKECLSGGRALIFPGEEDFGMIAVEAHACGRPVIALARGGALEIVIPELNGIFFAEETASSLAEAVVRFESIEAKFQPRIIQETARPFREARFEREIRNFIFEKYQEHCDHFKVGRREYEPHF
ncbi:MAG: glycosyl transferase [Acidobacteria bacterium]|nr:MAG: glycosyl transferase [Acidobacteriota bacterium]